MAGMIRREALRKLGAGSIAAALFAGNASGASSRSAERAVALRGRLGIENAEGRTLRGFIETGIAEGIVLCTLMERHPDNPEVVSVSASPQHRSGQAGIEVTITLYDNPVGDVSFGLLHLAVDA